MSHATASAPSSNRRTTLARLVTLWLVLASTVSLAPRLAPPDPWLPVESGAARLDPGHVEADLVAWSAGTSTAAACEALRAARSRSGSELSTAALPTRFAELHVAWHPAAAPFVNDRVGPIATRTSHGAPRAPPA